MLSMSDIEEVVAETVPPDGDYEAHGVPEWRYRPDDSRYHTWRSTDGDWYFKCSIETTCLGFTRFTDGWWTEYVWYDDIDEGQIRALILLYLIRPDPIHTYLREYRNGNDVDLNLHPPPSDGLWETASSSSTS